MAVKFPQYDNEILGGSDTWDNGLSSEILLQDYFEEALATTTYVISANTGADFGGVVDSKIRQQNPTDNYGSATFISVAAWDTGDTEKSVIKFGGITSVPSGTVVSARLRIYCIARPSNSPLVQAYALARAFVENQTTWNEASTGTNWGTAGAGNSTTDYVNTLLGSVLVTATGSYFEISGSALIAYVQAIINGGTDNGLLLVEDSWASPAGQFAAADFESSNGVDGLKPELVLEINAGASPIQSTGASKVGATASASAVKIATSIGASKVGAKSSASGTKIAVNTGASKIASTGNAIGQASTVTSSIGANNQGVKNTASGFKIATGAGASRAGIDNAATGNKIAQSISSSKFGIDSSVAGTKIALSQSTTKQGATSSTSGTKTAISTSSAKVGVDNSASGTKTVQSTGASKTGSTGNAIGQVGTVSSSIGSSKVGAESSASGSKTAISTSSAKVGVDNSASGTKLATGVGASKVGAKVSAAGVAIVVTSGIGASKVGAKASASGIKTAPSVGAGKQAASSTANGFKIAVGIGACRAGVKSSPLSELFVPTIKKQINFRGPEWITVSQGFWNS